MKIIKLKLKEKFSFIEVLNWGEAVKANAIINTTSVGLKKTDEIHCFQCRPSQGAPNARRCN